jgi:ATP-dependent DNA ligase
MEFPTVHEFPTLHKKKKNSRWQLYNINVIKKDGKIYIEKISGLVEGKLRKNYEEISVAKSKKTIMEQAIFNAKRIWLNKKQKDLFKENKEDIDNNEFDISRDFRPQLTKTFNLEKTTIKYPVISQRKYDGNRAILYKNSLGDIVMETRNGHQYLPESVKFITEEYTTLPNKIILDGELFIPGMPFQELQSIVRLKKSPPLEDTKKQFKSLKFYTFDIAKLNEPDLTFEDGYTLLNELVKNKINTVLVENDIINSKNEIKAYHDKYVSEGYEGIIIRNKNKKYGINKRNSDILKYKYFIDDEYKIIGIKIEINNGLELPMWKCITNEGKEFTCRPIGSTEHKLDLLKNYKQYIGKLLTVKYQELSNDGIPRFGVGKSIREFM